MLDYCPGLEPEAAASLAAAASEKFPASVAGASAADDAGDASPGDTSSVVIAAHLDGCCYLLNSRLLGREPAAPASSGVVKVRIKLLLVLVGRFLRHGSLSDRLPWGPLCAARWGDGESEGRELAASLAPLAAAVKAVAAKKSKTERALLLLLLLLLLLPFSSTSTK